MECLGRHRPVPLGHKDVRGQPLLALQTPQGAYLVPLHWMNTRSAVLCATDMQATGVQLDLMRPACYRLVEERNDVSLVMAIWRRGKAVDVVQRFRTIR